MLSRFILHFAMGCCIVSGLTDCSKGSGGQEPITVQECPNLLNTVVQSANYQHTLRQVAFLKNGEVWCTDSDFGLYRVEGNNLVKVNDRVGAPLVAQGNNLYALHSKSSNVGGLSIWNPNKNDFDIISQSFKAWDMRLSPSGELWGYTLQGLYRYNPATKAEESFRCDVHKIGGFGMVAHEKFECLAFSPDGRHLWLAGQKGVLRWEINKAADDVFKDSTKIKIFPYPFGPVNQHEVLVDRQTGRVLIAAGIFATLYELDPGTGKFSNLGSCQEIVEDHQGNVWIVKGSNGQSFTLTRKHLDPNSKEIQLNTTCPGKLNTNGVWQSYFNSTGKELWIEYPYEFDNNDALLARIQLSK